MISNNELSLSDRLQKHPKLLNRIEALLGVVENIDGNCTKADDAEQYMIDELRKMGEDAMHCWADNVRDKAQKQLREQKPALHGHGKKKVCWHTTFGKISIIEAIFSCPGQQFRPFLTVAEVTSHCCSRPLQRAVTDFGADHAFGGVVKKLHEHYGIELPVSTIRDITEFHAHQMYDQKEMTDFPSRSRGAKQLIGEIDGSLLPIVTIDENQSDKRKGKSLSWKEARLALAHKEGSCTIKFDAVFNGNVDDAGQALLNCAVAAGFGKQTKLHVVGDGAVWIANQVEDKFGLQGTYLADYYHVCEYLADAAKICSRKDSNGWMDAQELLLKNNEYDVVLENLTPYLEADDIDNDKAPVRACYRYLNNRTNQLDYKGTIEKGLPIGSGEIESAHRYVIQKRLKLAGAWWKGINVDPMLRLRVVRANNEWDDYWKDVAEAA